MTGEPRPRYSALQLLGVSGACGQVCLGQASAKMYGLSRRSYGVCILEIRSLIFVIWP